MSRYRHKWGKILLPFITVISAVMFLAFLYVADHKAELRNQTAVKEYRRNVSERNGYKDGSASEKPVQSTGENGMEVTDGSPDDSNTMNESDEALTEDRNTGSKEQAMNGASGEDPDIIEETEEAKAGPTADKEKEADEESDFKTDQEEHKSAEADQEAAEEDPEEEPVIPTADVLRFDPKTEDMNILFVSDLHLNDYEANKQIGVSGEERAAAFLEAVRLENEKKPVTAIFVLGDLSSDDLPNNTEGVLWFKENIVDSLDIPVYCLPGNHDVKTDKQWRRIFGYGKNYVVEMGDYVFLCYDTFNDNVNKIYNTWRRTKIDGADLKEKLEKYKDHKVFVLAHFLHVREDSETFDILKEYQNVKAVIIAHNHDNIVYTVDDAGFKVYTDGNFSKDFTDPIVFRWRFLRFDLSKDYIAKHLIITENNYSTGAVKYSDEAIENIMGQAPDSETEN